MRAVSTWLLLALLCSCGPSSAAPPAHEVAAPAQPAPSAFPPALTHAPAARVVAIGDLHGDLEATRRALRLAAVLDAHDDRWAGGTTVVVQTGDAIDRGDQDREVLDLLEGLGEEARRAGGDVVALSGNHELMNVIGDFRYVTPASFSAFGGQAERAQAFAPGGAYARLLSRRPIFARVGDAVFVHGGILERHLAYGLARMHDEVRAWLLGERKSPPMDVVAAEDSPVWSRLYSAAPEGPACAQLGRVLSALGAARMVVGHTPQPRGISSACGGRVWRIDAGMSHFYGGPTEVLELSASGVRVLRAAQ